MAAPVETPASPADPLALRAAEGPGAGFAASARAAARARLARAGLPGRRDEYWRWTSPAALAAPQPAAAAAGADDGAPVFDGLEVLRLVFTDGRFDAAQSDDPALAGVEILSLSAAAAAGAGPDWAEALYGRLEAQGQSPVGRPFASLNTAVATEGALIRVTGRPDRPVQLDYRRSAGAAASDAILHHLVRLDEDAELTLLETGVAGARVNIVAEIDLARGARLHHIRPQGRLGEGAVITHLFAEIGPGATLKSFTLGADGRLTRNEAVITIAGDHAVAHVAGAVLADGRGGAVLHDDTVFVTHAGRDCESRQVFKKVLKGGATGVFQGKILVKPGAQKTDGYQISQSLLLDEDSQFLAKPELEIYADDVKCSHGSTTGAIDATALFYLRSRGIDRDRATALLVLSFLADAIAEIEDPALAEAVVARIESWLGLAG